MERYICIHGHFYQPPRENPWLEGIEFQDSAFPYHDWNERITAECYAPNTASRIMDEEGRIIKIPNNYSKMSFNFGPTLLSWLENNAPETYESILTADRQSQISFSGHGSALAQAYNHLIMPLAHPRDKHTQVVWGIEDFIFRFGRQPHGMWLPEAAVDLETLEILAEQGIIFTILSPYQAWQVRPLGENDWQDVSQGHIDPSMAYVLHLPSGRKISLFFYDGPISQAIAFEDLLARGENLAFRLLEAFSGDRQRPQLVHIATDGETYGHHHPYGDMALAYALDYLETNSLARITNYAEFLEKHPPTHEVQIFENSSWSCIHGIDRWRQDCGCSSGMHPGWRQTWRAPLREALDWLRDTLAPLYEQMMARLVKYPWQARNDYIKVVLDRSNPNLEQFLVRHGIGDLTPAEKNTVLSLLEMQRHAMLMYTSCGWFFDELSGLETVQVIQYAGRTVQLAQRIFGDNIEKDFLKRLELAHSNIPGYGDGRRIYEKFVKPAMVDLLKVGAHYAISSLFEEYKAADKIYCYDIQRHDYRLTEVGNAKLAVGMIQVTSDITLKSATISFAVLHFGDHNICGGVREFLGDEAYGLMAWEVTEVFAFSDFPETIRRIDKHFGDSTYSLRDLFRDEQRKVLDDVTKTTLTEVWNDFGRIYNHNIHLMRFLKDIGVPLPKPLMDTAEKVVCHQLRQAFREEELNLEYIRSLLQEAQVLEINLEAADLEYSLRKAIERMAKTFREKSDDLACLEQLASAIKLVEELPFQLNLWKIQNDYFEVLNSAYPQWKWRYAQGQEEAQVWIRDFLALGEQLAIRVA